MRPRLAQLHQSGAADGEVPVWDDAADMWVPGAGSGGGGAVTTVNGQSGTVVLEAQDLTTRFQPLVQVVGGVPELVYDSDNNLIVVEVPNP